MGQVLKVESKTRIDYYMIINMIDNINANIVGLCYRIGGEGLSFIDKKSFISVIPIHCIRVTSSHFQIVSNQELETLSSECKNVKKIIKANKFG
jgi:hypothetical protein